MALDFTQPVRTKHDLPMVGRVQGICPISGKMRVGLPSLSAYEPTKTITWYHYDPAGNCSVIGEPNDYDPVNFNPLDGGEMMYLHGDAQ